jgi:hypothetical protein
MGFTCHISITWMMYNSSKLKKLPHNISSGDVLGPLDSLQLLKRQGDKISHLCVLTMSSSVAAKSVVPPNPQVYVRQKRKWPLGLCDCRSYVDTKVELIVY